MTRRADREALLLGAAGLLPSQRRLPRPEEDRAIQMEESWLRLGGETPMSAAQWDLFRVRPGNHPSRRLAAMAGLLETFPLGLEQGILALVRHAIREGCSVLEEGLLVPASGYWADHQDFGLPAAPAALLGRGRASQIAVNVALPFAGASVQYGQDASLGTAAARLFRAYPRLEPDRVTRDMESKLPGCAGAPWLGARHQQGMHYLYRWFCQRGCCPACPAVTPA